MAVTVSLATPLRRSAGGSKDVQTDSGDVAGMIEDIEQRFPGFKDRLVDESGELRRFINIYVNGEDIRFAQGVATSLKSGDKVSILAAAAGG